MNQNVACIYVENIFLIIIYINPVNVFNNKIYRIREISDFDYLVSLSIKSNLLHKFSHLMQFEN